LDTAPPDDNVSPYNASKAQNLANLDEYQHTFKTLQHDNPVAALDHKTVNHIQDIVLQYAPS
jgi:ABC-type iron transport system FetAB ATPase subunit